jgi:hypothetical protein
MGRFMVFLSTIFGLIGFIVLFLALCIAWSPNTFEHWMMWNYIFAAIASALSFLIFGCQLCSDNECKLGKGGVTVISIFLFWLCAANTVKSFAQADNPEEEGEDTDDLYYENEADMYSDKPNPPRKPETYDDYEQEFDEEGNPVYYDDQGNAFTYDEDGNILYYDNDEGEYEEDPDNYQPDGDRMPEERLPRVGEDEGAQLT